MSQRKRKVLRPGLVLAALVAGSLMPPQALALPPAPSPRLVRMAGLKERDRLQQLAGKAEQAGRLAEAVAAMEKVLTLEKALLGVLSDDVVGSLQALARFQEARDDLATARRALVEVAALQARRFGNDDWQAADAHFALAELARRAKLSPMQRGEHRRLTRETLALDEQAEALYGEAKYSEATKLLQKMLDVRQKLYPAERYPQGHPDLALNLNNLGSVLQAEGRYGEAEQLHRDALAIWQNLYPAASYPIGHPNLAQSLNNLGLVLRVQGRYGPAERFYHDALAMRRRLYPAERYPNGHPDLAQSLNNLGAVLEAQGKYNPAEKLYRDALAMRQKLYPQGHHALAGSLNNVAGVLEAQGRYGPAERFYHDALAMRRRLYPAERYPNGHPDLAQSLNNLGAVLEAQGKYNPAEKLYRDALAMRQKLYPVLRYPQGHPHLATSLNNLATVLNAQGQYGKAEQFLRQALAIYRKLYPVEDYPQGHPNLATSLNNVGVVLDAQGQFGQAEKFHRNALAMRQNLYPKERFSQGHPDLVDSLDNLAVVLNAQGEYGKAEQFCRVALAMRQKLYPAKDYPEGHRDLAASLHNLGAVLLYQGQYGPAERFCRDALAMHRKLYPAERYPQGHPNLASSLNNLAGVVDAQGQYGLAEKLYREALAMGQKLYPVERYPDGHPDLAGSLNNLAGALKAQGQNGQAEDVYRDALSMHERLYPADRFPHGHPALATSLNNLGTVLEAQGQYGRAEQYYRDALAMRQQLYPKKRYPQGHPELGTSLNNLGFVLDAQGRYGQAEQFGRDALAMYQDLVNRFAQAVSEAQALDYLASLPGTRDAFLGISAQREVSDPEAAYAVLWPGKGALLRVLQSRQRLLHAANREQVRQKVQQLLDVRRDLAQMVLAPADVRDRERPQKLQKLNDQKEELEKELAQQVPELARELESRKVAHTDLVKKLSRRTAFIDLYRYLRWDAKKREWKGASYVAFVLQPDHAVRRVELGDAKNIEEALARWRKDIGAGLNSSAGEELRRLLWEPLNLPAHTSTVYICPDGPLSALPWAALPGNRKDTFLLEDCGVVLVPHGLFLYEQLKYPYQPTGTGALLAVGAVQYDDKPEPVAPPKEAVALRPAQRGGHPRDWPYLKGTLQELEAVLPLLQSLDPQPRLIERRGPAASTGQLLLDLPRARWANLATHGFFAAPDTKDHEDLRPDLLMMPWGERRGVARRNPLTLTGLVLAGANRKDTPGRGILTAEAIAGLNLNGMELAVLSACETGLGEATQQGVFGLQRAFHMGGCRTVIASLWKVDDDATAALMKLFYHHLWEKKQPPLEALRNAQLALLWNPQAIPALARSRGQDFTKTVKGLAQSPAAAAGGKRKGPAPVKHWAAFVLSGAGR